MDTIQPTTKQQSADDIRLALVARIAAFCRLTRMTRTKLGLLALNDGHAVKDIEAGRNISLRTCERFNSYLNEHWPSDSPPTQPESTPAAREGDASYPAASSSGEVKPD